MPRGEKSGNPQVKRHRASRIAQAMMRQGVPRAQANRLATAAMEREYAGSRTGRPRRASVGETVHDRRTGQSKTGLTTKKSAAVSGAAKPAVAQRPSSSKRGGNAGSGRRPRAPGAHKSAAASRRPPPWKSAGYRHPGRRKAEAPQSKSGKRRNTKRAPRSLGPGGAGTARKGAMAGRVSPAKKSSGVSRTARRT